MAEPAPPESPLPAERHVEPVLIGPIGAGKSTLGRLLAQRLACPQVALDDVRFAYYAEIGYDAARASELRREEGLPALYRYWKPFEIHAVERALTEHHDCVFDFGAGHSVYDDPALFARAQRALAPFVHLVLLLPAPDVAESVRILRERLGRPAAPAGFDVDDGIAAPLLSVCHDGDGTGEAFL